MYVFMQSNCDSFIFFKWVYTEINYFTDKIRALTSRRLIQTQYFHGTRINSDFVKTYSDYVNFLMLYHSPETKQNMSFFFFVSELQI